VVVCVDRGEGGRLQLLCAPWASRARWSRVVCTEPVGVPPPPPLPLHAQDSDMPKAVESMFLMALVWSVGSVCDAPSRGRFDLYVRHLLKGDPGTDAVFRDFLIKNPAYDAHFEAGGLAALIAAGDDFTHSYDSDDEDGESKAGGSEGAVAPVKDGPARKGVVPFPDEVRGLGACVRACVCGGGGLRGENRGHCGRWGKEQRLRVCVTCCLVCAPPTTPHPLLRLCCRAWCLTTS
jgi:hypothetical protein